MPGLRRTLFVIISLLGYINLDTEAFVRRAKQVQLIAIVFGCIYTFTVTAHTLNCLPRVLGNLYSAELCNA